MKLAGGADSVPIEAAFQQEAKGVAKGQGRGPGQQDA